METRYQPDQLIIVRQPSGSKICGQCVISMLANQPIEYVLNHLGSNGTRFNTLFQTFLYYGVEVEHFDDFHLKEPPKDGMIYICIVVYPNRNSGHWVAYRDGIVYCPSHGEYEYASRPKWYGRIKWHWRVFRRIKP